MTYRSKIRKNLNLAVAIFALVLTSGFFVEEARGQSSRDPFATPPHKRKQSAPTTTGSSNNPSFPQNPPNPNNPAVTTAPAKPAKPSAPTVVDAPPIQARIDYYYKIREEAAENGQEIPKVTSVLLLAEMSVSGILKTPRGYAALVEAKPINLSYTIYPGEKFFDGQLVAVEENRLIFRKVSKLSNGKFVSSVENKALRKYSLQQELQGAVPPDSSGTSSGTIESASNTDPDSKSVDKDEIISPLDEMNKKSSEEDAEESAKDKKPKKDKKQSAKKRKSVAKKNN